MICRKLSTQLNKIEDSVMLPMYMDKAKVDEKKSQKVDKRRNMVKF